MIRGAPTPAGEHTLVYTYEPGLFRIGAIVSLAGAVVLLTLVWRSLQISSQLSMARFYQGGMIRSNDIGRSVRLADRIRSCPAD